MLKALVLRHRTGPLGHHLLTQPIRSRPDLAPPPAIPTAELLDAITRTADLFGGADDPTPLFDRLLAELLALTGSEYGFIGEVLDGDDGPALRTWAITDVAWDEASRRRYDEDVRGGEGLRFTNPDTLFGAGWRDGGRVVISNDVAADPRAGGRPPGHPALDTFLGVPIVHGGVLVGQAGVANRAGGYHHGVVGGLMPFLAAIGHLIDAYRAHRSRRDAEAALQRRTDLLTGLVSGLRDAVMYVGPDRRIVFANQHFCDLWGYDEGPEALVGQHSRTSSWLLMSMEERARADLPPTLKRVADPDAFLDGITRAYLNAVPELGVRDRLRDGRVVERDFIPVERGVDVPGSLWIYRDVTDRVQLEEQRLGLLVEERRQRERAEEQNRSLVELDRLKTEFVATVSHELRTPLTAIVNYAELLAEALPETSDEVAEFVEIIDRNAQRLLALTDDLLLVARLESGGLTIERAPLRLAPLVAEVVDTLRPEAEAAGLEVTVEIDPDPAPVVGDRARLAQVVENLLANAVKFTPEGGSVVVRARREATWWVLEVADTGIGIPEEEVDRLFDRFFRASNARLLEIGGSGLGLAIVRAIVELHDGALSVQTSERGTTVAVSLPDPEDG